MSVCCTFQLIFVNKSMLTADTALLPTQIIRGTFRTYANLKKIMSTSLHLEKSTHICTSLQVKVL